MLKNTKQWKEKRLEILKKVNYTCQCCHKMPITSKINMNQRAINKDDLVNYKGIDWYTLINTSELNIDKINPINDNIVLDENLQVLCTKCNKFKYALGKRKNYPKLGTETLKRILDAQK